MNNGYFDQRNECPGCLSESFSVLYKNGFDETPVKEYLESFYSPQGGVEPEYLTDAKYLIAECKSCGLIYQKYIPNNFLMDKLYGKWIDPVKVYEQHRVQDDLQYYSGIAKEIMQIIASFDTVPSDLDFFDFGMGLGQWALMAKAFGCNAFGLELTKERITSAKANGIRVITWEEIPACQFDFINTEQVFEHLSQPLETLLHLVKALKPNGILKISVPTAGNIDKRLKLMDWTAPKFSNHSLNPVAPLEHINFFRRESILKMASIAGLKEICIPLGKQYQYMTNWSGIKNIAINVLQPIRRTLLKDQNYCLFRHL